tara:strand:+ start:235 stop:408 length:174 start_codon:yes stop_codon:yes gene_type:complete
MKKKYRVACVQLNSGNELKVNVKRAKHSIIEAAQKGAEFVFLPECVALLEPDRELLV